MQKPEAVLRHWPPRQPHQLSVGSQIHSCASSHKLSRSRRLRTDLHTFGSLAHIYDRARGGVARSDERVTRRISSRRRRNPTSHYKGDGGTDFEP